MKAHTAWVDLIENALLAPASQLPLGRAERQINKAFAPA
jgi:hypothetical protein